jgi:hypothetical protein
MPYGGRRHVHFDPRGVIVGPCAFFLHGPEGTPFQSTLLGVSVLRIQGTRNVAGPLCERACGDYTLQS